MMRSVVCRMYPWCMATLARQGRWLHLHTRIASACSQTVLLLALPDGSVQAPRRCFYWLFLMDLFRLSHSLLCKLSSTVLVTLLLHS